jgi:hypothetical protein
MICKICDGTPIGKLFKMNKNKKIMRFESKRGQNEEKLYIYIYIYNLFLKFLKFFCNWKNIFSLLLFFGWSFDFAFQR